MNYESSKDKDQEYSDNIDPLHLLKLIIRNKQGIVNSVFENIKSSVNENLQNSFLNQQDNNQDTQQCNTESEVKLNSSFPSSYINDQIICDIYNFTDSVIVLAFLPGLTKQKIKVKLSVNDCILNIEADYSEKRYEIFESCNIESYNGIKKRKIKLDKNINFDETPKTTFENGVLELRFPKNLASVQKEIHIL